MTVSVGKLIKVGGPHWKSVAGFAACSWKWIISMLGPAGIEPWYEAERKGGLQNKALSRRPAAPKAQAGILLSRRAGLRMRFDSTRMTFAGIGLGQRKDADGARRLAYSVHH